MIGIRQSRMFDGAIGRPHRRIRLRLRAEEGRKCCAVSKLASGGRLGGTVWRLAVRPAAVPRRYEGTTPVGSPLPVLCGGESGSEPNRLSGCGTRPEEPAPDQTRNPSGRSRAVLVRGAERDRQRLPRGVWNRSGFPSGHTVPSNGLIVVASASCDARTHHSVIGSPATLVHAPSAELRSAQKRTVR